MTFGPGTTVLQVNIRRLTESILMKRYSYVKDGDRDINWRAAGERCCICSSVRPPLSAAYMQRPPAACRSIYLQFLIHSVRGCCRC